MLTKIISVLSYSILIILVKLDTVIFTQFRYHLSPMIFKLAFGKRATDIFQFSTENYITAVLFICFVIGLQILFFKLMNKIPYEKDKIKLTIKATSYIFIFILFISHIGYAWADANNYRSITQTKNLFPAYFPLTADSVFAKLNLVNKDATQNEISIETNFKNINYPLKKINTDLSKATKKNILFIVVDSWRYDSFTGINKGPVLIDQLIQQKYNLNILSSSTVENPPFNKNVFTKVNNLKLSTSGNTPSERDQSIFNSWTNYIDKYDDKNPFFGFLFFDAAHGFDFPKNYNTPFKPYLDKVDYLAFDNDYNPNLLINRYKNCLHFVDNLVGKIILQLEEKNKLKNTIIIITSDHGQEFNDLKKGYWQHGGNFSKYQINTPFIVFDSEKGPKKYNHLTLHYDLVPTLMNNYLGVTNKPIDFSSGNNLFENSNRKFFVCGYNQKFAIIEQNKITNIYPSGIFDVVDNKLNPINDEPNSDYLLKTMNELKKYYKN
jgi:membrane-anchored protein YejM (alkaline phosphatase superfamily)